MKRTCSGRVRVNWWLWLVVANNGRGVSDKWLSLIHFCSVYGLTRVNAFAAGVGKQQGHIHRIENVTLVTKLAADIHFAFGGDDAVQLLFAYLNKGIGGALATAGTLE